MAVADRSHLDLAELGRLLQAADPAALLMPPRLLRRVVKHDRQLAGPMLRVPHRKCYVVARETLLQVTNPDELGVEPGRDLPATVVLIARPEPDALADRPRDQVLVEFWRLLFHARVHQALAGRLTRATVRERIHRIGEIEFDEARTVLHQEVLLLPPRDDNTAYEEFAALYLELSFFAAPLLPTYFPAIDDFGRIDRILAGDVDGAALFAATRPAGAPEPAVPVDAPARPEEPPAPGEDTPVPRTISDERFRDLAERADRAAAAGNLVRAGLRRTQAAGVAPPALAVDVQARARADLDRLVARLRAALHLDDAGAAAWREALPALLPRAARGVWPAEARLLYDLQKVCVDHERPVFAPDLVEWAYSRFREPLVRPLPDQPLVLAVRHLRGAAARLPAVRVAEDERYRLFLLLHDALHRAEDRLRDRFRPLLADTLTGVGLQPQNYPERIARDKVVEELLDRVVERGFLNLGDLRDALARNQLKVPDLAGPGEFLAGDAVIRANRELAARAPGVYRRGEIYLRWLQRLSAVAFGTRPGRWFTLFLALPFGAAFATIVFAQEILKLVHLPHHLGPDHLLAAVAGVGTLFLLLLHLPTFRELVVRGLHAAWRATRTVLIDLPAAFLRLPAVRRLLASRVFALFVEYVLKPLPPAALAALGMWLAGADPPVVAAGGIVTFLAVSLLLNSPLGRSLEEDLGDWAVRNWDYWSGLLPGLVRLLSDVFHRLLDAIDRALYSVDEWLRFRGGESRLSLAVKTVLGFLWSGVAYVIRLYVSVFVEPTINPLKHFPAVTVAAKFLVPLWIPLTHAIAGPLLFLGKPAAYSVAFFILHAIPGAAGFLVWELKENWRLYRANRPPTLRPVMIGHHGETMLRLMKPGFHSGTLPKLYARLRRAERRAERSGDWRQPRRLRETLRQVEEAVARFTERQPLAYLAGSRCWQAGPVRLAGVEAATNRIRLKITCPGLGEDDLELTFEEQAGRLLAHVARPGWLPRLSAEQTAALALALTGFDKEAGVDLVREQVEALFAPECPPYTLANDDLVLWPDGHFDTEIVYHLEESPTLHPRVVEGKPPGRLPELDADRLLFSRRPVAWQDWVEAWERDQAGAGRPGPLLPGLRVLPLDDARE